EEVSHALRPACARLARLAPPPARSVRWHADRKLARMGLDALAKRYFSVIVCLMLAVAAYFQASGLGQLVGALIAPASAVAKGQYAGSRRVVAPESDRDLHADVILERN